MLIRWADRFPGGRGLLVAAPVLAFLVVSDHVPTPVMIQYQNAVILGLSAVILLVYRKAILAFFKRHQSAGATWLGLSIVTSALANEINISYSAWLRTFSGQIDLSNSMLISFVRFLYMLSVAFLFIAAGARDDVVPAGRWICLSGMIAVFVLAAALADCLW